MTSLHCPTCKKQFDAEKSKAVPFCSERCRQIDLGRWLKEEISVPHVPDPDDESEESWSDEPQ